MKNRLLMTNGAKAEQIITTFGQAKLVTLADGSTELRGGQPADWTAAKEWISMFMHEAVPKFAK